MAFDPLGAAQTPIRIRFFLVVLLLITGLPATVAAEGSVREQFQDVLEAMWTGRIFTPASAQRHHALKTMLSTGAVKQGEAEIIMEKVFQRLLNQEKTTRYNLQDFPERFNSLFRPFIKWDSARQAMWRALSAAIDKTSPVVFKVGTLAPPGTPWLSVPETLIIPEIERLSDGRIRIKIYGGGVMGDDDEILKKMDTGQLDTCGCTAVGVLAACPEASALLMPGLFNNYEEVDYICKKFRKQLDEGFEKNGYTLWALIDTGFFYLFSKNKTSGLKDIANQKVLTWFGIIERTFYQELGINPIPVAVPDIVAALNTGQADINMAPAAWMLGMQAYQYSNYYIKPPVLYSPAAVIINSKTEDRVREQLGVSATFAHNMQEMIVFEFNQVESEWKHQIRVYETKSLKAFETKCGMKAITLPPEDQETLQKAAEGVQQRLAGRVFPKNLIQNIKNALTEYREKH